MIKRAFRRILPKMATRLIRRAYQRITLERVGPYDNIYHCCTWKSASQWIRSVLSDPLVYRYTGMEPYAFEPWRDELAKRAFPSGTERLEAADKLHKMLHSGHSAELAVPRRSIALCFYLCYESYGSIPKPPRHKAFFLMRDPRDLVVSWYFSMLKSHTGLPWVLRWRRALKSLPIQKGMRYAVRVLADYGVFAAMRSWVANAGDDPNARIFLYEDLAEDSRAFLSSLFEWLEIKMPASKFDVLCTRSQFSRFATGRRQGQEAVDSHYRKGVAGDWVNHLDEDLIRHFTDTTGDLLQVLGYEPR